MGKSRYSVAGGGRDHPPYCLRSASMLGACCDAAAEVEFGFAAAFAAARPGATIGVKLGPLGFGAGFFRATRGATGRRRRKPGGRGFIFGGWPSGKPEGDALMIQGQRREVYKAVSTYDLALVSLATPNQIDAAS
jgi:hypothetical protein